jgi:transcriptional regulator with XRE-family HTH domain
MLEPGLKPADYRPTCTDLNREVIRCQTCGLVRYRTRLGNCRRCVQVLAPNAEVLIRAPRPQSPPTDARRVFRKSANFVIVANIGERIRHLRVSSRMTQGQLRVRSRLSKSYLSRVETGLFIPSIATLEKIAKAIGIGVYRFLAPETTSQTVLEDPFIWDLRPLFLQLDWEQRQSILRRLAAISNHVPIQPGAVSAAGGGVRLGLSR